MIKIVEGRYFPIGGISKVTIATKIGNFTGYACFNPEDDKKYESRFVGCEIAEIRARKEYFNAQIKIKKIELKTLNNLMKNLNKMTPNSVKNQIQKTIEKTEEEIKNYKDAISYLDTNLPTIIKNYYENKEKIFKYLEKMPNQVKND